MNLAQGEIYTSPPNGLPGPFEELEPPSNRVALLLDRFTQTGDKVLHYSNDSFFPQTFDRGLFQFIPDELDRENLTKTMDLVRGWITNVEGPTAGPFATCQFNLLIPTAYVTFLLYETALNRFLWQSSSGETGGRDSHCHL